MSAIKLFIESKEIELNKSVSIPLTFQFSDLTNPTVIKNNFSKTIVVPSTPNNDAVFNHLWRMDSIITTFDPAQRSMFVLYDGTSIIDSGYVRLSSISYYKELPESYSINLYGGLGDFFLRLSERTMLDLNIDREQYEHTINRETVINSWTENNLYKYALTYSGIYDNFDSGKVFNTFDSESGILLQDIAFCDGVFMAVAFNGIATSTDGIEYDVKTMPNGFAACNRIIADPNEKRFIAYNNQTNNGGYVYVSSDLTGELWEQVRVAPYLIIRSAFVIDLAAYQPGQNIVGVYSFLTDSAVFVSQRDNINFIERNALPTSGGLGRGICGFLNTGMNATVRYTISTQSIVWTGTLNSDFTITFTQENPGTGSSLYGETTTVDRSQNYVWKTVNKGVQICYALSGDSSWKTVNAPGTLDRNWFLNGNFIWTSLISPNVGALTRGVPSPSGIAFQDYTTPFQDREIRAMAYGNGTYVGLFSASGSREVGVSTDLQNWEYREGVYAEAEEGDGLNEHERNEFRSYYQRPALKIQPLIEQIFADSEYTVNLDPVFAESPYYTETWLIMDRLKAEGIVPANKVGNIRSGDMVTYDMMMNNNITQLDFLRDYFKSFGLVIWFDKVTKEVNIVTRNTYFENLKVLDWNEKIDNSKNKKVTLLPFDFRYGVLKWNNNASYYEKLYEEKERREYGYTRVNTGYQFNDNEKLLIDDVVFSNTVIAQEWSQYFEDRVKGDQYRDDKVLPALYSRQNDRQSYNESSFHIVFFNGMHECKEFVVSDDNPDMTIISIYMYTDSSHDTTKSTQYPLFTTTYVVENEEDPEKNVYYSLYFGLPSDLYYSEAVVGINYPPETATIYSRMWERYIVERYNSNNKVLDASFFLNRIDINQFTHSNFVLIDNVIYFVNMIRDFNAQSYTVSECQLQRVSDISAYQDGQVPDGTNNEGGGDNDNLRLSKTYHSVNYKPSKLTLQIIGGSGNFTYNKPESNYFYSHKINGRMVDIDIPQNNSQEPRTTIFHVECNKSKQQASCVIHQSEKDNINPPGAAQIYFNPSIVWLTPSQTEAKTTLTSTHNWSIK